MGVARRAASLASIPLATGARLASAAAATALGADREAAYAKAGTNAIESITRKLAEARGPAMKFGQALATLSSALPEDQAAALQSLTRLYEDAEPRSIDTLAKQLRQLPRGITIEPEAVAAASLGQVHRGTGKNGSTVAVKIQYSDAARLVRSDMAQIRAVAPMLGKLLPNLDLPGLVAEHADRLHEELDYTREAHWQETFRTAWQDEGVVIPRVLHASPTLLVSEWVDGTPFASLPQRSSRERNQAGRMLARFCLWSPELVGATHADPHPGNFRLLPDGRLAVLDFGSVGNNTGTFTRLLATTLEAASTGDYASALDQWKASGLMPDDADERQLMETLDPDPRPYSREEFTFSKEWLQARSRQFSNPATALDAASKIRFPPSYLLEHRAVMGTIGLLCSIDATVDFRAVLQRVLQAPGIAPQALPQ